MAATSSCIFHLYPGVRTRAGLFVAARPSPRADSPRDDSYRRSSHTDQRWQIFDLAGWHLHIMIFKFFGGEPFNISPVPKQS